MNRRVLIAAGIGVAVLLILILSIGRSKKGSGPEMEPQTPGADVLYKRGASSEAEGDLRKAAKLYQELIEQFPDFKQISDVERKLWDLNIKILFSPVTTDEDIIYKVEPGDVLLKIAKKHNTTAELIMRSNNLESDLIRPGQRLKVSGAKYSVIIDKSQNSLTLKANEAIFKVYSVATGKYNGTPVGKFKIAVKLENPDWYKAGVGPIPAESPENILGTRWLGLEEGYGIHGGASEQDLGSYVTKGCIRMTNADVEELFIILPRGTEVTIFE